MTLPFVPRIHPVKHRNKECSNKQYILTNCILFLVTANEHAIIIATHSPPHVVVSRKLDY